MLHSLLFPRSVFFCCFSSNFILILIESIPCFLAHDKTFPDQQAYSVLASSIFHLLNFSVKFPYFYAFSVLIVFVSSYVLLLLTSVSSCACCNIIQSQWRHQVFFNSNVFRVFVENCWQERNSCNKNEWSRQCACAMTSYLKANHSPQIHPVATLDPKNLIMNPKTTRMTNCKPTNTYGFVAHWKN